MMTAPTRGTAGIAVACILMAFVACTPPDPGGGDPTTTTTATTTTTTVPTTPAPFAFPGDQELVFTHGSGDQDPNHDWAVKPGLVTTQLANSGPDQNETVANALHQRDPHTGNTIEVTYLYFDLLHTTGASLYLHYMDHGVPATSFVKGTQSRPDEPNGMFGRLSPDGTKIAIFYTPNVTPGNALPGIVIYDVSDPAHPAFVNGTGMDSNFVWKPDSSGIVYTEHASDSPASAVMFLPATFALPITIRGHVERDPGENGPMEVQDVSAHRILLRWGHTGFGEAGIGYDGLRTMSVEDGSDIRAVPRQWAGEISSSGGFDINPINEARFTPGGTGIVFVDRVMVSPSHGSPEVQSLLMFGVADAANAEPPVRISQAGDFDPGPPEAGVLESVLGWVTTS